MQLTQNFELSEFLIGNEDAILTNYQMNNLVMVASRLQVIRDITGKSIHINSGFRTKEHNAEVGGATGSYHTLGMAADIRIDGMTPAEVQLLLLGWSGGLGFYDTFTHIDTRPNKVRF